MVVTGGDGVNLLAHKLTSKYLDYSFVVLERGPVPAGF